MTLISSLLRLTNYQSPFLRTLLPSIGLAFGIQAAVAIPSIYYQTERFYDLSGSITYISCTALSLYLPTIRARAAAHLSGSTPPLYPNLLNNLINATEWNWRQVILSIAVTIWASRLGSFLYSRITSDSGRDSRFDSIRSSPLKFFVAFLGQATWVSACLLPVLSINSLPTAVLSTIPRFTISDIVGLSLFVGGLGCEIVADRQKSKWLKEKKEKKHSEEFLTKGLWSKSRHPNYFGESTLWTGIATLAGGVLVRRNALIGMGLSVGLKSRLLAMLMAGISPAFVTFLLLFISGVPLSEEKYDKKYGDRKDYKEWKRNTPMFIPKLS